MKKAWMGLVLSVSVVCAYAQKVIVDADRDQEADLSKYKTFYWASQVDSQLDEGGIFFLNDLILKAQIRDAVKDEMMALGYRVDSEQPDLIVNFRVFDKSTRIKSIEDYGPGYWTDVSYKPLGDTISYEVKPGTILLSLVDGKKGKVVFQGFASGLINNNEFIKDEVRIREAVHAIIDEADLTPKDLSKKD